MVLLTHGHYDHIGACKKFQNNGIKIAINLLDADKCESDELCLIKQFGNGEILDTFKPDILFENEEDNLVLGSLNIKVIHTPGHSKGGSSYLIGNFLLSGDTIFEQGYGRTDFYDGSSIKLRQSIRKLLTYLNKGYILCCGH